MAFLSMQEEVSNGVQTVYPVDFDFRNETSVYVYKGLHTAYEDQLSYRWTNGQIELTNLSELPEGTKFYIRRIVPRNQLSFLFENRSMRGKYVDEQNYNQLYLAQELMDGFHNLTGSVPVPLGIDMLGNRIENLGDAEEDSDAVNLAQVKEIAETASGGKVLRTWDQGFPEANSYKAGTELKFTDVYKAYTNVPADDGTLMWLEDGNVGDEVAVTATSHLTLAQAQASDLPTGRRVVLTDYRHPTYEVVDVADTGGYYLSLNDTQKLRYVVGMTVFLEHFGVQSGEDNDTAVQGFLSTLNDAVENYGTDGSTVGQPENLGQGVTGYFGTGNFTISGDFEVHPFVGLVGSNTVLNITSTANIRIAPVFTYFERISFVSSTKRVGIEFTDFPGQLQTDVPVVTFSHCVFKGFSDVMNTYNTTNPRSLRLVQCRSVGCLQFSSMLEFDNAEIVGGSYTPEFSALDAPYINNHGSLQVSGVVFIPVDDIQYASSPVTTTPREHYRWFDNHRNLTIDDSTRFGNELVNRAGIENSDIDTPQVTVCYNYADISDTSTLRAGSQLNANLINNSLIIKDSIIFARHTAIVKLFGLPATLVVKGNTGEPEAVFEFGGSSVIDLDLPRTVSSAGGLFDIDAALRTRLESNSLELQRVANVDIDLHRLYTPLVVSSASILEPLLTQLRRNKNGLPELLIPRTQSTTNSDFYFLTDMLPSSFVFEVHMTSYKGASVSKAGYRIVKRRFDNGGTTTSQLLATQLYTQDWSGGITVGHENVSTATSTNLVPRFIGVRFTDMSTSKLNNRVELKFLSL